MDPQASDRGARMALSVAVDAGEEAVAELVDQAGAQATWGRLAEGALGDPLARRAAQVDLGRTWALAQQSGARFLVPGDEEWPGRLSDLRHCAAVQRRGGVPFGLWVRGPKHLAAVVQQSVAIVGSRASTPYGETFATDLAADLCEQGVGVVSGGAYGVDAAAHRGALAVGGPTVCVLACGVDVAYPRGNLRLIEAMAETQLLVSELPPGATPTRVRFLARNRLIAALSQGTVVVEASYRSGARNTASWALECQRHLMAVPGPVHSNLSAGPHLMIRNGQAMLVTSAAEVLELVADLGQHTLINPQGWTRFTDALSPSALAVFEAVPGRGRKTAGEIALGAGVSVPTCLAELSALEQAGRVEADERGWCVTRRR